MKKEMSYKIPESVKKTGIRTAAILDAAETSVVLAAFKAISSCTSFALDRIYPNSKTLNNGLN